MALVNSGMPKNPLESALVSNHMKGLPKMGQGLPKPHMPKFGMHENQPKVKPLASGFHNSFMQGLK